MRLDWKKERKEIDGRHLSFANSGFQQDIHKARSWNFEGTMSYGEWQKVLTHWEEQIDRLINSVAAMCNFSGLGNIL